MARPTDKTAKEATVHKPTGAALVVGAGIAGVQAALDLAESGIKVYLLERSPAIGGKMAQLDKTFPTNDCAMCIISPKLVDASRHCNIEIIATADLLKLKGEPGNFTATIFRWPRYVDIEKCTACADCVKVCPIHVPNEFDEGLAERAAIFKPYAQAVPNAYAVTKKGTSPCKQTCPAGTSAQGYIALIAEGRYEEALEVIKQYNPFPATVGRVCHHPCESECNRGKVDSPVAICALKRFVADKVYARRDAEGIQGEIREISSFPLAPAELPPEEKRRVAVVGSGPCGLTAAYFLTRMGYRPTVFEALPVPGGMMRVGIPAYRLPRQVLRREIDEILKLGAVLKLDHAVRDINGLFDEGYSAVFLAIGAHEPQKLGIPGEDVEGVFQGVPFLRSVSLGEETRLGDRVVVVGGGNTAIDTSRTALRMGSKEVTIVYRRSRAEMPANSWEVDEAEVEGVRLELLAQPIEVLSDNGRISGVRCIRMRLGEPDASGRRRPIPIGGSEFVIECEAMVAAVAQAPEISFLDPDHGLEISRWGTFKVDPQTLATNRSGVFAGGDAAAGPGVLIAAIAAGRRGALSIDRYLRGVPLLTPRELTPLPVAELTDEEIAEMRVRGEVDLRPREVMPTAPVSERIGDFREVELGLTEEQAHVEALRCLRCGLCSECYQCVLACKVGAIDHQQAPYEQELKVGAVVLAPGYQLFDPERYSALGYGRYPNVITSMQFERLLSASGPTGGHVARPSDHQEPKRIAFLQCIGSRDREHDYCSAVCCMYATKEAVLATEHVPEVECHVFLMDMRAFGKGFDAYFQRAQTQYGIRYVRSRIPAIAEDPNTRNLHLIYETEDGQLYKGEFNLVVLSVGMEPASEELAIAVGINLDERGFCQTEPFKPVETSRPGVYVCGAFAEPKDIPESVIEASGAAAAALSVIGTARGTLVEEKVYPPEIELAEDEEPRIGVFICSCGSNIAGVVDVNEVVEYARTLPDVVYAENTIYTCSADSLKLIQERIAEHKLNRVIVSSCTPRTHEPLFQDTIREAGLNPYLFEMANIRDQCSWVHSGESEAATAKAKDLTRMAVGRSRLLMPLYTEPQSLSHEALVIGGGVAGMSAALNLAQQGFGVYLVERERELGGRLRHIYYTADGGDPQAYLRELMGRVQADPRIEVLTGCKVVKSSGFVGNFKTTVVSVDDPTQRLIEHGVTIVATGGRGYRGDAYLLGQDSKVITQDDFEQLLTKADELQGAEGELAAMTLDACRSVVMIQCVGPWDDGSEDAPDFYCSRVCCTVAIKNAMAIKKRNPGTNVYILYKDVRTYGFKEALYTQARDEGLIFLRYDDDNKPQVQRNNGQLQVAINDPLLQTPIVLKPDLLVLSEAMVPAEGSRELAELLKFSCTLEGFFLEAHVKLRPVDFPAEGIFLCGAAHYPKFIDEAIAQANAAAARATTILSRDVLQVGGVVAVVDEERCTGCLTCVRICPYDVPRMNPTKVGAGGILGAAEIAAAACQGCGSCAAECPAKAIQLQHYRDEQIMAKEEALFERLEKVLFAEGAMA
jgi:heterodisulfide reductase subunit A-like polyferredoxin